MKYTKAIMWKRIVFLTVVATASCGPVNENGMENVVGTLSECLDTDTTMCLKEKVLNFTERLAISKSLDLFEGMSLISTGSARSDRSYEPLVEEPKAREQQIDERILDNVSDFLDNHVLHFRLTEAENESRALDEEARGKKKKKQIKKLLPLLLLLKLKFAALIPIFLGIIAIVAIKAVFLGKIAFAMQAVQLIRKLFNKNQSSGVSTSYGVAQHHDGHLGYSYEPAQSGWGRQDTDGASLAYAGRITK